MDILSAVVHVLKDHDRPVHFKDIAKQIADLKLVDKAHQTIETLVNAKVGIDIRNAEKENRQSRFQKLPNGFITLTGVGLEPEDRAEEPGTDHEPDREPDDDIELPEELREPSPDAMADRGPASDADLYPDDRDEEDVYDAIQEHNRRIAKEFARYLNGIDFPTFERHISGLIRSFPIKRSTIVNRRKDGGMDFAINIGFMQNNLNLLVAVRRWGSRRLVTMEDVNETFERMKVHGFNACIYVATGDFDSGVYDFADGFKEFPFFLVNGERLAWITLERKMIRDGEQVSVFQFEDRPAYRSPGRPDPRPRDSYAARGNASRGAHYAAPHPNLPPA